MDGHQELLDQQDGAASRVAEAPVARDPAPSGDAAQDTMPQVAEAERRATVHVVPKTAAKKPAVSDEHRHERICREIAHLYQLSKRETEAFMYVSKGRNAEYVAKEMVISIHTAKTHIANIYRKLDVHSSQELLDLIDEYARSNEKAG